MRRRIANCRSARVILATSQVPIYCMYIQQQQNPSTHLTTKHMIILHAIPALNLAILEIQSVCSS